MAPKRQSSIKTRLTKPTTKAKTKSGTLFQTKKPIDKPKNDKAKTITTKDPDDLLKTLVPPRPIEVHQEHLSETDKKLRGFDLDYKYGPCVGLTRLERWERAESLGLDPPQDIKTLLLKDKSQECLFHGHVI